MKYWSDLGRMRVNRGCLVRSGFSPVHQLHLCKGWLPSCCIGLQVSVEGILLLQCTPQPLCHTVCSLAAGISTPSCRFAALQRLCSQGKLAGSAAATGPGQLCNRSSPLKYLTSLGGDRNVSLGVGVLDVFCDVNVGLCWAVPCGQLRKGSTVAVQG